jgi:hypothetical protein
MLLAGTPKLFFTPARFFFFPHVLMRHALRRRYGLNDAGYATHILSPTARALPRRFPV